MRPVLVRDAAELLGVSEVQVGRLIAAGDLEADRVGRSWVIDPEGLRRYAALRPAQGRPLSASAAWRAIRDWQPRDLESARRLAVAARRRSERRRGRVAPGELAYLLADERVVLGGADAAAHRGVAVAARPPHDIYVRTADADLVVAEHLIDFEADEPNVRIRSVADRSWPFEPGARFGPLALAVVDLVDGLDERGALEALAELAVSR